MAYLYAGLCTLGVCLFISFLFWFCEKYPELYAYFMCYLTLFAILFFIFMAFYQLFS